jgi:TonB family protein
MAQGTVTPAEPMPPPVAPPLTVPPPPAPPSVLRQIPPPVTPPPSPAPPSVVRQIPPPVTPPRPDPALVSDNYLWEVVRKLRGYRFTADSPAVASTTVLQIVIARDGRLVDAHIVRSSGHPKIDQGVLAGLRAGSPYTPLPSSIPGDRASFTLPIVSAPVPK